MSCCSVSLIPGVTSRLSQKHPRSRSRGTVVGLVQASVCTTSESLQQASKKLNYRCPHWAGENYCLFHCKTTSCEVWSLKRVIPDLWDVTSAAPVPCRHPGLGNAA